MPAKKTSKKYVCALGFDCFLENGEHRPFDGWKIETKTHLQKIFFDFFSRFLRVWLRSFKKVLIWPIFLEKIKNDIKNP